MNKAALERLDTVAFNCLAQEYWDLLPREGHEMVIDYVAARSQGTGAQTLYDLAALRAMGSYNGQGDWDAGTSHLKLSASWMDPHRPHVEAIMFSKTPMECVLDLAPDNLRLAGAVLNLERATFTLTPGGKPWNWCKLLGGRASYDTCRLSAREALACAAWWARGPQGEREFGYREFRGGGLRYIFALVRDPWNLWFVVTGMPVALCAEVGPFAAMLKSHTRVRVLYERLFAENADEVRAAWAAAFPSVNMQVV